MGKKTCKKCNKEKTFGEFRFTGKKKKKSGKAGTYRLDTCLLCEGNK